MSTQHDIITGTAFDRIQQVVNKMVNIIRPTYGPASNKVLIDKEVYRMVVDDGVQIARDFELNDPVDNAIVKVIREALIKTNDRAGDGTTGAAIMLQAIINEVGRKTRFDGRKVELELKKGLEDVKQELRKSAKQIKGKEDLKKVALVSFDDEKIADMIATLYHKLGKDAIITMDKSSTMETSVETTDGIRIERGFISPYMVNNPDRMETVFDKPYILLTDYRLTENTDIMPLMNLMASKGLRNLVVIADNVEQHALATLVINQPQVMNPETKGPGSFPSVAISLPASSDRKVFLEDLAILTGAKVISLEKGDKLENTKIEDLGRAQRIICNRDESIIVSPGGKKADVNKAIEHLRKAIASEQIDARRKPLEQRLGLFTNTLAVIKVGAPTDNEQKALKYKVEDALHAVKSAYRNGVVCGSGLALARIETSSPILNEALKYPNRQFNENMGIDERPLKNDQALNAVTGKVGNFLDVGVMDPVDVLLAGVESAVSIASILLTTTSIIVQSQKEQVK